MRNLSLRAERPEFMRLTMRSRLDFEIERRSGTLRLVRCAFLPVAVTTNVPIAGTSIAATSMSAPLRAASVSPMPLKAGNGTAASIPAPTPASSAAAQPLSRPANTSSEHGWYFHRGAARPTIRHGGISRDGPRKSTRALIEAREPAHENRLDLYRHPIHRGRSTAPQSVRHI
jgi:hypothetical protein